MQPWPADRTNLSRSGQCGSDASNFSTSRQRTVATSADAHRQAGVAALGLLHRIEGEKADRVGHCVMRHARRHRGSPSVIFVAPPPRGPELRAAVWAARKRAALASDRGGRRNLSITAAPIAPRVDGPFNHRVNKASQWTESKPPWKRLRCRSNGSPPRSTRSSGRRTGACVTTKRAQPRKKNSR